MAILLAVVHLLRQDLRVYFSRARWVFVLPSPLPVPLPSSHRRTTLKISTGSGKLGTAICKIVNKCAQLIKLT